MSSTNLDPHMDERVEEIINGLAKGKTRDELSDEFGHQSYKTLDAYMRRKGFGWSRQDGTYTPIHPIVNDHPGQPETKADRIVTTLAQKGMNTRTVAKKFHFTNHIELGEYMSSQGYEWDVDTSSYVFQGERVQGEVEEGQALTPSTANLSIEQYLPLLELLNQHQEHLTSLLGAEESKLPRYKVPGKQAQITAVIVSSLGDLLKGFSQEKNITQKEILQIALIEFFQKYGYKNHVNRVLQQ